MITLVSALLATPLTSLPSQASVYYLPFKDSFQKSITTDDFVTCYLNENDTNHIKEQVKANELKVKAFEATDTFQQSIFIAVMVLVVMFVLLTFFGLGFGTTITLFLASFSLILLSLYLRLYNPQMEQIQNELESVIKAQSTLQPLSDEIAYRCIPDINGRKRISYRESDKQESYYKINEKNKSEP